MLQWGRISRGQEAFKKLTIDNTHPNLKIQDLRLSFGYWTSVIKACTGLGLQYLAYAERLDLLYY